MKKTGSDKVFIDVSHLHAQVITTRFPHIYRFCMLHGLDITREPAPVAPAAHYMMGGIKTNTWGETNISGLFAAGETACSGVHGANRLASNSMLEVVVFSKRIVEKARAEDKVRRTDDKKNGDVYMTLSKGSVFKGALPARLSTLQQLHWDKVGVIRNVEDLTTASGILASWYRSLPPPEDRPSYELSNLVLTGRLVTEAALLREESRGAHFRADFPHSSPEWQRHIVFTVK
jgi:L-aspartate oxidase